MQVINHIYVSVFVWYSFNPPPPHLAGIGIGLGANPIFGMEGDNLMIPLEICGETEVDIPLTLTLEMITSTGKWFP